MLIKTIQPRFNLEYWCRNSKRPANSTPPLLRQKTKKKSRKSNFINTLKKKNKPVLLKDQSNSLYKKRN